MDRRERERILGEWGVGVAERTKLVREGTTVRDDLEGSPLAGKPLRRRLRNFRAEPDLYIASLGGPLPYMQRLRAIADEEAAHERELAVRWRETAAACARDARAFERRWTEVARGWNFYAVNDLIETHNRNYPAEARLPMDPRTGDFALVAGRPYRRRLLDAEWVLERFPADLHLAVEAA
jgi:hypothetical protein